MQCSDFDCGSRAIPPQLRLAGNSAREIGHYEVMETDFYRIKRLPPYVIAEVNGDAGSSTRKR